MCVCVVCVRACVRACLRVCVCVCVSIFPPLVGLMRNRASVTTAKLIRTIRLLQHPFPFFNSCNIYFPCISFVTGWSAMNVYLTALALSDTAMLYTGTLPVWTNKMFR